MLKKNPDYWTAGQPYLDELNFFVLTDANARMLQFQSGELDIATDAPFSQLDALRSNPDVQLLTDAVARIDYIAINHLRFPDVKVRQAINYAVDKDAIIKNVLFGAGELATTMLPKMLYWNPDVTGLSLRPAEGQGPARADRSKKDGFDAELLIPATRWRRKSRNSWPTTSRNSRSASRSHIWNQPEPARRRKTHDFDFYMTSATSPPTS